MTEDANPPQDAVPNFAVWRAVANAYLALLFGLPRFVLILTFWSAVGAVLLWLLPEAIAFTLRDGGMRESAGWLVYLVIIATTSVFLGIATFRWIILGEPVRRLLPADKSRTAEYGLRWIVLFIATTTTTIASLHFAVIAGLATDTIWTFGGLVYVLESLIIAVLAPTFLALASHAAANGSLTFLDAWKRTAGSWRPLFYGTVVCHLPFTAAAVAMYDGAVEVDDGTLLAAIIDLVYGWLDLLREIVFCAFIALAYLHFMRDDPHHQSPAVHFE